MADIHGKLKRFKRLLEQAEKESGKEIGSGDTIIILGDFFSGVKNEMEDSLRKKNESELIEYMSEQSYDVISIRGNHDLPTVMYSFGAYPDEKYGDTVLSIRQNISFLSDGHVYEIPVSNEKTCRILAVGGALSHSQRFKTKKDYKKIIKYKNTYKNLTHALETVQVDYVMAHDCPSSKMGIFGLIFGRTSFNEILDEILSNVQFKRWFYGHHHIDCNTCGKYHCVYNRVILIDDKGIDSISTQLLEDDKKRSAMRDVYKTTSDKIRSSFTKFSQIIPWKHN